VCTKRYVKYTCGHRSGQIGVNQCSYKCESQGLERAGYHDHFHKIRLYLRRCEQNIEWQYVNKGRKWGECRETDKMEAEAEAKKGAVEKWAREAQEASEG
jgi:hypothetical protein